MCTLLSQNVQGLEKSDKVVRDWFKGFSRRSQGGRLDVVLLQETKASSKWAPVLEDRYARAWGDKTWTQPLSFWHPTSGNSGGVAILLRPDSVLTEVRPWQPASWSDRFIAVQGQFDTAQIVIINIYAPTDPTDRERFFRMLAAGPRPTGTVLLGGDFNCVLDPELDRSRPTRRQQVSPALADLLVAWDLVDTVIDEMNAARTREDVLSFQRAYHSYYYPASPDTMASARLDRWYVSKSSYHQVGAVEVITPVARTDHDAVRLSFHHAAACFGRLNNRRHPQLRYPLPVAAADAILETGKALLNAARATLCSQPAATMATAWDALKVEIRRESLRAQREALAATTARTRARVRRLREALTSAQSSAAGAVATPPTVEGITRSLAALSLDPVSRYKLIRARLIALQMTATARVRLRCFARHAGAPHESARAFFRRISAKFTRRAARLSQGNTVTRRRPAERVAADWRPIIQRPPRDPTAQAAYFARLPPRSPASSLGAVDEPITEAEVRSAIAACPRGKACGPDGLGNDWYHDVREEIAPLLASMFSAWLAAGVAPPSFREAVVYCLPKTAKPKTGLDYHPISLLNTDYKVYARILLQRVQRHKPDLVSPTQFGAEPGRQVHDALDVWSALHKRAADPDFPTQALAVLLDFSKAYDSLDRAFLSLALRRLGFPPTLVQAVHALHLGTTAQYVVDGDTSSAEAVCCGIRQGCPLAPTLFVLAVDTFFELVRLDERLPGVPLTSDVSVTLVGYADDTTAYLQSPAELQHLDDLLGVFSAASGLEINKEKSTAIFLRLSEPTAQPAAGPFPLAEPTQLVRYLGRQISTVVSADQVWLSCVQQIRSRLHLALVKTSDVLQRVQVAQAIILPKLLYVARHDWPSAAQLDRLQRLLHEYVWFGSLLDTPSHRRAWLSADIASLPHHLGGLQVPQLRDELLLLSARTVSRWTSATDPLLTAVGAVLSSSRDQAAVRGASPGRGVAPRLVYRPALALAGNAVVAAAAAVPRLAEERAALASLLPLAGKAPLSQGHWQDGWYVRNYACVNTQLHAVKRAQHTRHGRVNIAVLLVTPPLAQGLFLHPSGRSLLRSDLGALASDTVPIGEILELDRVGPLVLKFRLRQETYPYQQVDQFRLLCDSLVMCYPDLLDGVLDAQRVIPRGDSADTWLATVVDTTPHLVRVDAQGRRHDLGAVLSHRHAECLARRASDSPRLQLSPHPLFAPTPPLWGSLACFSTKRLRATISATRTTRAKAAVAAREAAQLTSAVPRATTIDPAITEVSWSTIHSLRHSSSRQRLALYRVKMGAASGWSRRYEQRCCPSCPERGHTGGSTPHIVWECPHAQVLWSQLWSWWTRLGLWLTPAAQPPSDFREAVFGLQLPRTPPRVWSLAPLSQQPSGKAALEDPYPTLQTVWEQLVLETLVVVFAWRRASDDPEFQWSTRQALAIHAASSQQVLQTLSYRLSARLPLLSPESLLVDDVRALFNDGDSLQAPPSTPGDPRHRHVLFFDGGSRGNPGPGGSGACLVSYDLNTSSAHVVWSGAMSLSAASTTNNQAEYFGLVTGLREARARGLQGIHVVGDSALIIRQLRDYRPPRNKRLLEHYRCARRLADQLGVTTWFHHVRAHNKMADALANLAMDSRSSSQVAHPTHRTGHAAVAALLHNDLNPWLTATSAGQVENTSH